MFFIVYLGYESQNVFYNEGVKCVIEKCQWLSFLFWFPILDNENMK